MDTSMPGAGRGAVDARELARYLRQRVTQLEADGIMAARVAAEELRAGTPDYSAAQQQMGRAMRLAERAAELRRVLQDFAL